jgi:aminoglycoside/choline kinase family phosphotransferase
MTQSAFPTSVEAITPAWLTAALGGPAVAGFEASPVGVGLGFVGAIQRLSLTYDHPAPDAPASVIVKFPGAAAGARQTAATFRLYEKEVLFYQDVSAGSAMRSPRAYHQRWDPDSGDFILVLEDLAAQRNGDQLAGLTLAEVRTAIRAVATMHAQWWESPQLRALTWIPPVTDPSVVILEPVFQQCWGPYCAFMGERLDPEVRAIGERFQTRIIRAMNHLDQRPHSLVHGDFRADNFFFGKDDAEFTVVDWQIVLKTVATFDLAYLLSGNLTVEDRRAHETALVELYHATLTAGGVTGYSLEDCWSDYRDCVLIGWMWGVVAVATLDPANERGVAFFHEWNKRICTAILDLQSGALLDKLGD